MPSDTTTDLRRHVAVLEGRIEQQDDDVVERLADISGQLHDIDEVLAALVTVVRGIACALKDPEAAAPERPR
jgi:hypothetical protein